MQEFDFLRKHGYGVVYGAEAVKQKIIELGSVEPKGKNNMNEITDTQANEYTIAADMVEILDTEGNSTGQYRPREASDGEAASAEATVFTTAEDGEHVV